MIYIDPIYGKTDINDPIILELLASPYIQRLKGIDQAGYFQPYFTGSASSRFDHSVGVYLLLHKYGAPLEEQISGLLHDISHGTFSHCLDHVFAQGSQKKQNHQDNIFESFIKKTDIPDILKRHNIDIDYIINDNNFPLKETKLPDICADRIDYILRDAWKYGVISQQQISYLLTHLSVRDGQRVFTDFTAAKEYTQLFRHMNDTFYASIEAAIMFKTVGDCLKYAWQQGYLHMDDFYTTDSHVLNTITKHIESDKQLAMYWQRMNNQLPYKNDPDDFDATVFCKNRLVDPLFIEDDGVKRYSDGDTERKKIIQKGLPPKEYFLKFT